MEFYSVKAMFGHVGKNNYIPKIVAVKAENGREAALHVRWMGRVKHNRKDAILNVKKITREEYLAIKDNVKNDPYFSAKSKQQQNELCKDIAKDIIPINVVSPKKSDTDRKDKIIYKMKKNKIIRNEAYMLMRDYELAEGL